MKSTILFFSSEECDIFYNKTLKFIKAAWKGIYVTGNALKRVFEEIIKALSVKGVSILIMDLRRMTAISELDREWIVEDWCPRAVTGGLLYLATVMRGKAFRAH